MCQYAHLFTKPLDIKKFHKHAKTVLNVVVEGGSNVRVYCERCKLSSGKDGFL